MWAYNDSCLVLAHMMSLGALSTLMLLLVPC